MNKLVLFFLIAIGLLSCQKEEVTIDQQKEDDIIEQKIDQTIDYNFIYILTLEDNINNPIYKQEYSIVDGKVLAEKYTNYNNPNHNHISTFEYDENGKVLSEIQEGEIFKRVVWQNNSAKVYNVNNKLIGEFNFNDQMTLMSYKRNDLRFLNYDLNGNVEAEATESGIFVEYLDYDNSIINPLSRINSIAILRIDYKPHFKYAFKTKKEYPYESDDFSVPLSFYDYSWALNSDGLIENITNDKTSIYLEKFEYK